MAVHSLFRVPSVLVFLFLCLSGFSGEAPQEPSTDSAQRDVYVEFKYVRVSEQALGEIAVKLGKATLPGIVDPSFVPLLLSDPTAETLGGEAILAKSGTEAVVRSIVEKDFPVRWTDGSAPSADIKADSPSGNEACAKSRPIKRREAPKDGFTFIPCFGDPTDLGLVLKITPHVDKDGTAVSFDFNPVCQAHIGDTCYSDEFPFLKMPIVEARTMEGKCALRDGEALVISSSTPSDGGKGVKGREFFIVTASVLPPGELMENPPDAGFLHSVRYIQIADRDLRDLNGGNLQFGLPGKELVQKLLSSAKAKILYNGQVLTKCDEEAISRDVQELYFPEDLTFPLDGKSPSYSLPGFNEAKDLGVRFSAAVKMQAVDLKPQMVTLSGWDETQFMVSGRLHVAKRPRIMRLDVSSKVCLRKGEFMPLAKSECDGMAVFVLLSEAKASGYEGGAQ